VGLLVADSLEDALATSIPPAAGGSSAGTAAQAADAAGMRNYVLAVDNSSAVPQMVARCGIATPVPVLLYVTSNLTLSKPPVLAAGIDVLRPLVLVGLAGSKVSLDFAMQVNQVSALAGKLLPFAPTVTASSVPPCRSSGFLAACGCLCCHAPSALSYPGLPALAP
jgi:hypothetical protein